MLNAGPFVAAPLLIYKEGRRKQSAFQLLVEELGLHARFKQLCMALWTRILWRLHCHWQVPWMPVWPHIRSYAVFMRQL